MSRLDEIRARLDAASCLKSGALKPSSAQNSAGIWWYGDGVRIKVATVYAPHEPPVWMRRGAWANAEMFAHAPADLRDLLALADAARALQVADRRHGLVMEPEVEVAMGAVFAALAPLLDEGEWHG